ncbi:hypothetical protein V6615_11445 [Oscillospiraceae bacterium PP1C4]
MDFNTLVEEIVARVTKQVEQAESACSVPDARPKLLILNRSHQDCCHRMLESKRLGEKYQTVCALLNEYSCDLNDFEAVLLYGLNNEALSKIAAGICDTPYTSLAVQAILMGKKIYAVRDDVELFDYEQTAPAAYYSMMLEKVTLLEQSGVVLVSSDMLEDAMLGETVGCTECKTAPCKKPVKEIHISKKVITEKDVIAAYADGATVLRVGSKSIITDLARDYAHERRIEIARE